MEIKIALTLDHETKNTVRYNETLKPQKLWSGTIYIQKFALGMEADFPPELELTIAVPKAKLAAVS